MSRDYFYLRLPLIADKLQITPKQAAELVFEWAEMGITLAEQLKVENPTPQAVLDAFNELQSRDNSIDRLCDSIDNLNQTLSKLSKLSEHGTIQAIQTVKEVNVTQSGKWSLQAEEDVDRAIDAVIKFNNRNIPDKDKWYIGIASLRKLTQRGDTVIKRVLKQRKAEIEQHHARHQIKCYHNCKGKHYPSINEVIKY